MEMIIVKVTIMLSLMLPTHAAASLHTHYLLQVSHHLADDHENNYLQLAMPRKLMLNYQKVQGKHLLSHNEALSGESHKNKNAEEMVIERSDPTHLFTMDYSPVRRRRPIHNKSFPTTNTTP